MAHAYQTDQYEGMIAETVTMRGHNGDTINAYVARPLGSGPFPGMVVIHHAPGWDEWYRESTRKFAHHGFVAISTNLYFRDGHGTPEDVAAKVRALPERRRVLSSRPCRSCAAACRVARPCIRCSRT
jgi:carboxymethylenebutenolidase